MVMNNSGLHARNRCLRVKNLMTKIVASVLVIHSGLMGTKGKQ